MCQVPALPSSHIMHPMLRQTSLRYISLDQVGQKRKMLCPETEIKAGDYLKFNILIRYYLKNQELPFIIYEEHSSKPVKSFWQYP